MGRPGSGGGEQFRRMGRCRCLSGRHAQGEKHRRRDDTICHAQSAIDRLGEKADQRKQQKFLHEQLHAGGPAASKKWPHMCGGTRRQPGPSSDHKVSRPDRPKNMNVINSNKSERDTENRTNFSSSRPTYEVRRSIQLSSPTKRYPTPGSVRMTLGRPGSRSILPRNWPMKTLR